MTTLLPSRDPEGFQTQASSMDTETLNSARSIVETVRKEGDKALRRHIDSFEQRKGDPLILDRKALEEACARVPETRLALLQRTADRIRRFADARGIMRIIMLLPVPERTIATQDSRRWAIEPMWSSATFAIKSNYIRGSATKLASWTAPGATFLDSR